MFNTLSHDALYLCGFIKICVTVYKLQNGHEYIVEMAVFNIYYV